jgi:N-acetylglucosaminyl-diphospho-decaprenol L-rhamnosyltransferase
MGEVAIVIVTFHSAGEIAACLDSALATGAEVVVVDNASTDGTVDRVRQRGARLIANPTNVGFAAAVNQGVRSTSAPFLLLLNPDAVIQGGLECLVSACSSPGAGLAGGCLVDASGLVQKGFCVRRFPTPLALAFEALLINRLWPGNPVNWQYRCMGMDYGVSCEVEQPAGAFLMFRREVWERLGGFDERFRPVWFEDVDFCLRARLTGYRARYVPGAVAKHTGGHAVRKIPLESRQLYWYGSLLIYASKHFSRWKTAGLCLAVMTGSVLRLMMGICHSRSLKPIAVYSRIVRLAGSRLMASLRAAG